ncbi:probable LRR receptor-like serine/threonine-protein kinase At1g56140 [Vigna unguiculata]|uniref:probable LRR receptor-like serine/threonine-protein kinase At1g56140 n=1 Tax=Vigna unguiculata TaxID=3917 RepID=UPI001015F521|nr:probable LRR receptor-like serine/threonine-protein kinase At1g56140 [Vigna unguiculata]
MGRMLHGLACALVVLLFCHFSCFVSFAQVQSANATTDPSEARVINSIFSRWRIYANTTVWNISGEVCSGSAIDNTSTAESYNPFIRCDRSFNAGTTCHITSLRVYALDVSGEIPEELWTLTYLTNLNLGQNFLSGSLPPAIGNLTRMQYLSLGINNLTGELPKELGNLSQLIVLSFSTNRFSGSLPLELGNLTKLEQLYFDSSGISGPIPSTFENLKNLVAVWASDMEFGGQIPDFIGNWTKLQVLRLQGNSFNGSIPSSFSKLTSLIELRISDISNGSSSLQFIRNMKSLDTLVLRNNNIFGSIPSFIGEFHNLTQLDLSFNNISGQIPESTFNLSSLSYVFLGNNMLSGSLPRQKSSSLQNIDLSYNNLSNNLPSWVNEPNLQLNLVANNFTIEGSNISGLPSGLNCLQKSFPCNSGVGRYYEFAIKCGGPQTISTDGTVYEADKATLGAATYFVTDTNRWAVSNVGIYTGSNNPTNEIPVSSDIFQAAQSARHSPSSLRYYGLGLQNGFYNITLSFAETTILSNTRTWRSLGRRVFDIYIQGTLVLEDFDIVKKTEETGGSSYTDQFRFEVFQNYLEIHLFWAGKGTCCIPAQGTYGPLIQAILVKPDFPPIVNNGPTSSKKDSTGLIVGIVVAAVISFLSIFVFFYIIRRRNRQNDDEDLLGIDTKPYTFTYSELKNATNDFSLENKLGEGGFGPVHKGTLNDGRVIAVKRLSIGSNQGKSQFVNEIATISAVQHRNLVKLYGCCIQGREKLIVYEYLANKSLDKALFGNRLTLDWSTRYDICLGVARGLTYLHEESRLRIIHRDVKASNILLDNELVPKISDFGLAKLYDDKMTHMSTRVAGTIGYLAPEYAMRGHLTEKADVFSFGIVALEIVSGRPNSYSSTEEEKVYLLEWAWQLHESNRISDLVDPRLVEFDEEEVKRIVGIVLLCTQASPTLRPSMSRAVAMLSGDIEVNIVTTKPGYLTDWDFEDVTSFMTTNITTKGSYTSCENSPSSTTTLGRVDRSPISASKPILYN